MLHFISSLFSSTDQQAGKPDKDLIARATDRVVDATDSRLRGFGNYRKRLYPAVEHGIGKESRKVRMIWQEMLRVWQT